MIDGHDTVLTIEHARELYKQLGELLGEKQNVRYVPYPVSVPINLQPVVPIYPKPLPYEVWCGGISGQSTTDAIGIFSQQQLT